MKILMMTLYSIVAWFALGTIGLSTWLGWAVLLLAIDLSITTTWKAITTND